VTSILICLCSVPFFTNCIFNAKFVIVDQFDYMVSDDVCRNATWCLVQLLPTMGKGRVSATSARQFLFEEDPVTIFPL